MRVLGIETATEDLGAAVISSHGNEAEFSMRRGRIHAEKLPAVIVSVMRAAGVDMKSLDGVAVSVGPGSFTGVRIGMGAAKAVAYALNIPVVPVTTLEALAHAARGLAPVVCGVVGAGRGNLYAALFSLSADDVKQEGPIVHGTLSTVWELIRNSRTTVAVVGDGVTGDWEITGRDRFVRAPDCLDKVRALAIAELGLMRLKAGGGQHSFSVSPVYVGTPGVSSGGGQG